MKKYFSILFLFVMLTYPSVTRANLAETQICNVERSFALNPRKINAWNIPQPSSNFVLKVFDCDQGSREKNEISAQFKQACSREPKGLAATFNDSANTKLLFLPDRNPFVAHQREFGDSIERIEFRNLYGRSNHITPSFLLGKNGQFEFVGSADDFTNLDDPSVGTFIYFFMSGTCTS